MKYFGHVHKKISICQPIVQILRMVDSNVACMGFVYEGMDGTKGHIFPLCNNDQSIYKPIWDIMDKSWCMLHRPLHDVWFFLALGYRSCT